MIVGCFIHPAAAGDRRTFGRRKRVQRIPVVCVFATHLARRGYETEAWQTLTPLITIQMEKVADPASAERMRLPIDWRRETDRWMLPRRDSIPGWGLYAFIKGKVRRHKGSWIRKAAFFSLARLSLSFFFFYFSLNLSLVSEVLRNPVLMWNSKRGAGQPQNSADSGGVQPSDSLTASSDFQFYLAENLTIM